jgi:hypothetical protein
LEHDLWAQAIDDVITLTSQTVWLGLCLGGLWPGHWSTSQWQWLTDVSVWNVIPCLFKFQKIAESWKNHI